MMMVDECDLTIIKFKGQIILDFYTIKTFYTVKMIG